MHQLARVLNNREIERIAHEDDDADMALLAAFRVGELIRDLDRALR